MDAEEKKKINILIDEKLDQLEATGLSREEILYDNPQHIGIPLSQDPFFQYLKKNYLSREVFLKPGEQYTVQKIVDLALRQDVGPDPSIAAGKQKDAKFYPAQQIGQAHQRAPEKAFDPDTYAAESSSQAKHYFRELVRPDRKIYEKPLTKAQLRKQNIRRLNYFDIHWRNTELLSQFLNTSCFIRNKYQNRLTKPQQKKVAKQIKISQQMLLLPFRGYIKPSDRKSLTTLHEDIMNSIRTAINIETGHIYIKGQRDQITKDYQVQGRGSYLSNKDEQTLLEARVSAALKKEQQLIDLGIDTKIIREKYRDPLNKSNFSPENAAELELKDYIYPPEYDTINNQDQQQLKDSYERLKQKILDQPVDQFSTLLVHEKATNTEAFEKQTQESELSLNESLEFINDIRSKAGLTPLSI
ncbi:hypothetical protein IMG5_081240 [Ichthyophthirius multifiliis]|uniref:Uncharacterized protein n=1 Tax=Ichthyophthirius multifiliis TaxID=5932 RepID=G0QQM3_ICHMU|nr:hypothetical protein IMG5_081240 [Ichthyophthirius multifiliis]EGR32490.1 hypothetical protein IMG5_081240 [Ichthyophthirius multifiliis]|eukprot:XP_004036476.1 hypothetical protein IMG5_081240 [Ichthyophthirius multifiliis]